MGGFIPLNGNLSDVKNFILKITPVFNEYFLLMYKHRIEATCFMKPLILAPGCHFWAILGQIGHF
jgi:hypothetical protein